MSTLRLINPDLLASRARTETVGVAFTQALAYWWVSLSLQVHGELLWDNEGSSRLSPTSQWNLTLLLLAHCLRHASTYSANVCFIARPWRGRHWGHSLCSREACRREWTKNEGLASTLSRREALVGIWLTTKSHWLPSVKLTNSHAACRVQHTWTQPSRKQFGSTCQEPSQIHNLCIPILKVYSREILRNSGKGLYTKKYIYHDNVFKGGNLFWND